VRRIGSGSRGGSGTGFLSRDVLAQLFGVRGHAGTIVSPK
jgi:hypothetical protein